MMSQYRHIVLVVVGLFLWSCSTEKSDYEKLVSEWLGREILFPEIMTDVITGDTIDLKDADFTILTYIDSAGCTGCRLKLPIWRKFMNSLDSLPSCPEVNNLIIINTDDKKELDYLIKYNAYPFSIIQDQQDSLNFLNEFPHNSRYRTFLLDNNNRILLVGNPVDNHSVAELYKSVISGRKITNSSETQIIEAENQNINLGNVYPEEIRTAAFKLKNHGQESVKILWAESSCHCTNIEVKDSIIPPNAETTLNIKYTGDTITGHFTQTIHVYYQSFDYPTILSISGNIIK